MRLLTLLCLLSLAPYTVSAESIQAGFVQGLWYAQEPVFADIPNRVYVAFRNNTQEDLTGTIHFSVNGDAIGTSDIRVLKGRVIEAWIDWTPREGAQKVTATMHNVTLHALGGETRSVNVPGLAAEHTLNVDRDTDRDGTGDEQDSDDDNDGISDDDERARGSDPRVPQPTPAESNVSQTASSGSAGMEQFITGEPLHTALSTITEHIDTTKQKIDDYRAARSSTTRDALIPESITNEDGVVITRESLPQQSGLWYQFIEGSQALLAHLWTFVLWTLSHILAHPVFVQLGLLLGILYTLFRTVRSIGQRPRYFRQ